MAESSAAHRPASVKPCTFDYVRAETAVEAIGVLADVGEDARVLAGGQSLMAMLNMRLVQPRVLVDISRTAELDYAYARDGKLVIGAASTQATIERRPTLEAEVPLLRQAFPHISHVQIRSRGTVCGSVAHADPGAELPLILLALDGEVVLRSKRGRRVLPAEKFLQGMLSTARRSDELVEEVRYPIRRDGCGYAFAEFSTRRGDFAIVAAAAVVSEEGKGPLAALVGLNERTVRTSVFRLAQEGWLASQQLGRRSFYRLTEDGRRRIDAVGERLYGRAPRAWDQRQPL